MKSRSSTFAAIAVALVVVVVGSFYWLRVKSPLALLRGAPISAPEAAIFIPKDAPVVASLLANPDRVQGLRQMRAPLNRGESRAEFDRIKRILLADTDLNYDRDIKPWLGDEVTLAVTRFDGDGDRSNGKQPDYLVALGVKDADKSREFLDLFWQNKAVAGAELEFEDYKGVELISTKPRKTLFSRRSKTRSLNFNPFAGDGSRTWASAVISDRFVLFANSTDGLRQAINRVQAGSLNLTNSPSYEQALANLTDKRLGLVYLDLPTTLAWIGNTPSQEVSPPDRDRLAVALAANPRGLAIDGMWLSADPLPALPTATTPVKALEYIPQTSALAVAGTDLARLWEQVRGVLSNNSQLASAIEPTLNELEADLGIDSLEALLSWATGEYALAFVPRDARDEAQLDWVFVAETSDATAQAIDRLDAIAARQGYSVGPFTLKGEHRVVAWTKLSAAEDDSGSGPRLRLAANVRGVHGDAGRYQIFTNSIETMDSVFRAPRTGSLLSREDFTMGLSLFPAENDGYLYANWEGSKSLLERQFPPLKFLELVGGSFFGHLQSLTTSTYNSEAGFTRTEIFLTLR
ncbi:MAG: DUF3352 domain-containing protein [Cyanobacteriota bacterium]|nr:DUF3352 domain-containing protein [Cyanobacteriota bacterium]